MNTLLLEPTDTLFFRDGRPMSGSLSGHGAAWPLPTVTSAALHAALHRADFEGVHKHAPGRSSARRDYSQENRDKNGRLFGSLTTAGPFPVNSDGQWFFPRPADAQKEGSTLVTLLPMARNGACSLPHDWLHPVGNLQPPTKDKPELWISQDAFQHYLNQTDAPAGHFLQDCAFTDTEHTIGIAIDPATGTTGQGEAEGKIYSAHSLRLREGWRMGLLAAAWDKDLQCDLVLQMLNGHGRKIIVGGQQRLCTTTVKTHSNGVLLPTGPIITGNRVKWVLLSPAIFPAIHADAQKGIQAHPGGWLPNWISPDTGAVLLKAGDTTRREGESREAWRQRVRSAPAISAKLTAALVGKPTPVTGYALPNSADPDRPEGGAKSTHLAVPAGSVYYFEAESPESAQKLAAALNWHGSDPQPGDIRNRRSTLFGEKGFGLGVCGAWNFHSTNLHTA
ncbi:MAG: hypothetical protein CJBNEKGG_03871 [Prosthecobacter sp.]|nr:hypothetical protein [Prosthecobacter sp.]